MLGYYGQKNFGDELILLGMQELFKGWEMQVYSIVSDGAHPTVDFEEINTCDLFVLGGGELIHRDTLALPTPCRWNFKNHSLPYKLYNRTFFAHLPWVKHIKIPKAILGCGCDSSTLNGNVLKDLAEFDYIGLRDQASVNTLHQYPKLKEKTGLFYDLAFQNKIEASTAKGDYAVVVPTGGNRIINESGAWLKRELSGFNRMWFVPFGQVDCDDYYTARMLSKNCLNRTCGLMLPNDVNLQSVVELLSGAGLVLPYRLHGLILAFMLGKPFRFYNYHSKVARMSWSLDGLNPIDVRLRQREAFSKLMEAKFNE